MKRLRKAPPDEQVHASAAAPASTTSKVASLADNSPKGVAQHERSEAIHHSPSMTVQNASMAAIQGSPRMVAQRKKIDGLFGQAAQRQEGLEEDLQLKAGHGTLQRQESEDEEMQPEGRKPRPITFGDFYWPAYREHHRRRPPPAAAPREPEENLDLTSLFPPEPQAPVTPQVNQQPALTPKERRERKKALAPPVSPQPATAPKSKSRRNKWTTVPLVASDVGGHLSTLQTPTHGVFRDIVIFTLNNDPVFTEIHVHRNAARVAIQISKKVTGQTGNGVPVPLGSNLFNEAAQKAAHY